MPQVPGPDEQEHGAAAERLRQFERERGLDQDGGDEAGEEAKENAEENDSGEEPDDA